MAKKHKKVHTAKKEKVYTKTHKSPKALKNHISKLRKRKATVALEKTGKGTVVHYKF